MKIKTLIILFCGIFALQPIDAQSLNSNVMSSSSFEAFNMINVTIGGDFPISGTYPALRTERVDQLITRILVEYRTEIFRTTPDEQLLNQLKKNINEFSQRNIVLRRFSGEEINIDLVKFRTTGNFNFNPYLNNDDVIIFPPLDLERSFVHISGAVNKEIKFEFVEGEKLSDAIIIAQGLNPAFNNIDSVLISRLSYDGITEEEIYLSINEDPLLLRGDRIRVLADESHKRDFSVLVLGEVERPGRIFISKSNTKLTDVINKAGGFTKSASLSRSTVLRGTSSEQLLKISAFEEKFNENNLFYESLAEKQKDLSSLENLLMIRMSDAVLEDSIYFRIDNKIKDIESAVAIDFNKLFIDGNKNENVTMKDGDVIVIPEETHTVYVFGHVNSPGFVQYDSELSVEDYIEMAGGLGEDPEDEIKVIRGKDKSWITVDEFTKIEVGDYIYVAKSPTRSLGYYLRNVSFITTIAAALTSITVVIINQLNSK